MDLALKNLVDIPLNQTKPHTCQERETIETETDRQTDRELRSWVEHSGEGIYGCHSHNEKLFE